MKIEKKSLTKREKVMLIGAGFAGALILMVQFVILPLNTQLEEKRAELAQLEMESAQLQIALSTEAATREEHALAIEEYEGRRTMFLSESLNSVIGRTLTMLVEAHELVAISQTLSNPTLFTTEEIDESRAALSSISVAMSISGAYNDLKRLLDTVERVPYLRMSRVSFGILSDTDGQVVTDRMTISFEVSMLKDAIIG